MENGHPEISEAISEPVDVDPYENKYYTLLKRCETIQQSNERLVHRLSRIKGILRRLRHERRFLMRRLDQHEDNYRDIPLTFQLGLDDETPATLSNADVHVPGTATHGLNAQSNEQDLRNNDIYQFNSGQSPQSMHSSMSNIPSATTSAAVTTPVASTSKRKRSEKSVSKSNCKKSPELSSSASSSVASLNSSLFLKSGLAEYGQLAKLNMDTAENISKS